MLISESYKKQNKILHQRPRGFGSSGYRWIEQVKELSDIIRPKTVLDYGAGEETLWREFKRKYPRLAATCDYQAYDPAVKGLEGEPLPADMVFCTDVLEHVEPAYLDNVLFHLRRLISKGAFFNIATHPANNTLPDGRNTHLIIEEEGWWKKKLVVIFGGVFWFSFPTPPRPDKDFNVILLRKEGRTNEQVQN